MTAADPYSLLRSSLRTLSRLPSADQTFFVQAANSHVPGEPVPLNYPVPQAINQGEQLALDFQLNGAPIMPPLWVSWLSRGVQTGVGVILSTVEGPSLLLDRPPPPALRIDPEVQDLNLGVTGAPAANYRYLRSELLHLPRRPQVRRFPKGAGSLPTVSLSSQIPFRPYLRNSGSHLQEFLTDLDRGIDYLLCEIQPGEAPAESIPLGAVHLLGLPVPRKKIDRITPPVEGLENLRDGRGTKIGEARFLAGGPEGEVFFPRHDLSGITSIGDRSNQEDGLYLAHYSLPDGSPVSVMVVADGVGGIEEGERAAAVAIQAIRNAVRRAATAGSVPLVDQLFDEARRALKVQNLFRVIDKGRRFHPAGEPDAVIVITVIVGNLATIATCGDAILLHCKTTPGGSVRTLGYTNVEGIDRYVTTTLLIGPRNLYQTELKPGSFLIAFSDGGIETLVPDYKPRASFDSRLKKGHPEPDQAMWEPIHQILGRAGPKSAALAIHQAIPQAADQDNKTVAAFHYRGGQSRTGFPLPSNYSPLWTTRS